MEKGDLDDGSPSSLVVRAEWLCGWTGVVFWNTSSAWDVPVPLVSTCFQAALWTFPPVLIFWSLLPFSLWSTLARRRRSVNPRAIKWSILFIAKMTITTGLTVVAIWDVIRPFMMEVQKTIYNKEVQ